MKNKNEKCFEIYTLSHTYRVWSIGLTLAIDRFEDEHPEETVIGCIEIDLFHKGATQKPDLE